MPSRFWPVCCLVLVVTGCGSQEPRALELDPSGSKLSLHVLSCELRFNGVVDRRRSERTSGPSLHTYEIENLIDYLDGQINAMVRSEESGPDLVVEVRHAYAQGKAMRGFYTVVLSAGIDDGATTVLRGSQNATNWVGSGNEFQRGLMAAGDKSLFGLHTLLAESGHCAQPKG